MKYQHYKGGIYTLITLAVHTETDERLVIYQDKEDLVFARPYDMFFEDVEVDGVMVPRFREIKLPTKEEIAEGFSKIGVRIMNEQLERYRRS